MITQVLLDWYLTVLLAVVNLVPALPPQMSFALLNMANAGTSVGGLVAKFGVLVPFEIINGCLQAWAGLVVWWFSMVLLRLAIWAVGR